MLAQTNSLKLKLSKAFEILRFAYDPVAKWQLIEQMFIEAPGLPSKPIKSASPQIRGEILKAEAEVFLQGDNFLNLISSRRHQLLMKKLKNSSREHVTFKGYVVHSCVAKENVQE